MSKSFTSILNAFKEVSNQFDTDGQQKKLEYLRNLSGIEFPSPKHVIPYADTLLFVLAYPSNSAELRLAEKEFLRISRLVRIAGKHEHKTLVNSGLPFTQTIHRFSHDMVRWLMHHPHCRVTLDSFRHASLELNDVLTLTLPSLERTETTAGLTNSELMDNLKVPVAQRLRFLVNELARLDHLPYIKDHFFERLEPIVCIKPGDKAFSKAYNRLSAGATYFHDSLVKRVDSSEILDTPLPLHVPLDDAQTDEAIIVVKNALVLTARETDPCTYMQESSFRLYHLERGISIAIFGMIPSRQLPLESYVGYTAFKNGYPVSYGGAWIFGERANFGINIFKPYRNGESAYIMAQLLRLYRHVFNLVYFEVEPYQYGLDNPDGITSGAFWFYYRFGFRPLDKHLRDIARKEDEKIKRKKGYRTSHKVLTTFTGSNIGLSLQRKKIPGVADITLRVTRMIQSAFKGDRLMAETGCRNKFLSKTGLQAPTDIAENQVLTEVALWAEAMHINDRSKLEAMTRMVKSKPRDVYAYQEVLIEFFS